MKKTFGLLACLALSFSVTAQSKIFKEIAGSVKSDFSEISESGSVIGYISMFQIEKTDKDSFNYEINIMDENLNDMGEIKFKEIDLDLQSVAFENNVLCMSFVKYKKELVKRKEKINSSYAQYFVNLQGEIISKNEISITPGSTERALNINVPGKGFIVFIRDKKDNKLIGYDDQGKVKWQHAIESEVIPQALQATTEIFGYYNNEENVFQFHDVNDPKKSKQIAPQIPKKAQYTLLTLKHIDNKLIYAGTLRKKRDYLPDMKHVKRGNDKGVFALEVSGLEKSKIKERVSYWADGSSDVLRWNSTFRGNKSNQANLANATIDNNGNVYYFSTNLQRKPRIGNIVATVVTLPTVFIPLFLSATGYTKYYYHDGSVFMLDNKNNLKVYDEVESQKSRKMIGKSYFGFARPSVMGVVNNEKNETHFVVEDSKEYKLYNVANKKTKTFPSSKKGITTRVYPAKDGHLMVLENNKSLKETKLSIVAL